MTRNSENTKASSGSGDRVTRSQEHISNELLLAIVEQSDDMIVVRSLEGEILYCNAASEGVLGYKPAELIGRNVWHIYPEDRRVEFEQLAARFRRGGALENFETVRRRKDGSDIFVSIHLYPLRNSDGEIFAAAGITRDITSRKDVGDVQKLVAHELQHRVKNMLAAVRSLLIQTARQSADLEGFLAGFTGRIDALARVQEVMGRTVASIADFEEVVSEELLVHGGRLGENVSVEGPKVNLGRAAAATVAMVMHELASNSVKFGALASQNGSITVSWSIEESDPLPLMKIDWAETGLDTVPDMSAGGFGRQLIEKAAPHQLNGDASLDFGDDALRCCLKFPLEQQPSESEEYGLLH